MYVSTRRYRVEPQRSEEILRRIETGFAPLIAKIPGFQDYYVVDAGGGEIVTVSVFETRPGVQEAVRQAARWVRENMIDAFEGPAEVSAGEVRLHRTR